MRVPDWFDRLAAHPLFLCGFRPLFFAAATYAVLALLSWLGFLAAGIALPSVPGGPVAWHAHELLFGFGLAAVTGFVLTAIPEFTGTASFGSRIALAFSLLWLAGRVLFWSSGVIGVWPAALAHIGLVVWLVALLAPRILRDPELRHLDFLLWGLAPLALTVIGFYVDALRGDYPMRWLHAAIGVMMLLIVLAMSRISMRIVNDALEALRERGMDAGNYYSRPPRRNLALFAIAVYTAAEFFVPHTAFSGWLGLVAAAALFNQLNDWHVGRALFDRWSAMGYAMYWLMALGYAALGLSALDAGIAPSAGTHLLTVGAMGLSTLAVLCIAGRIHAGYVADPRSWVLFAATLLVIAALLRALSGFAGEHAALLLMLSGLGWVAAFLLATFYLGGGWLRPRVDGGIGCEEVREGEAAVEVVHAFRVQGPEHE
ncbi:MAG TPA: NnrS family protein [Burkholderiales bacterium]|nr:NnrS family protein [Burkholderiales bacterium]